MLNKVSGRGSYTENAVRNATVVIAVATVVYMIFSGLQWRVMIRELEEMREVKEQTKLERRAWIGPVEAIVPKVNGSGKERLGVKIRNSGMTPGLKVIARISHQYLTAGDEFEARYEKASGTVSISVLQPGMGVNLFSMVSFGSMKREEIDGIKSGKSVLYIYGLVNYEDVFKRGQLTKFCLYLDRDLKTMSACHKYNEAN